MTLSLLWSIILTVEHLLKMQHTYCVSSPMLIIIPVNLAQASSQLYGLEAILVLFL